MKWNLLFLGWVVSFSIQSANVKISCPGVGVEFKLCKSGAESWAKQTKNTVTVTNAPNDATERLGLYQTLLGNKSSDIDVFPLDVIWTGILQNHFLDLSSLPKGAALKSIELKKHFPVFTKNNVINGKLLAMPWYIDAGLLYYRKDLLKKYSQSVPTTWEQLSKSAKLIQTKEREAGNKLISGYVFQGRAYEGLTCNALEWVHSYGGSFIEPDGKTAVNSPQVQAAFAMAASWIGDITPKAVLNYAEEDSRGKFQTGNAVFLRNWPYVWKLANEPGSPIKGKVGVTVLPKGGENGKHSATLGGASLAVSKYSKVPKEALDLVLYLTSAKEQKRRSLGAGLNPTHKSLYKDSDLLKASPFLAMLYNTFDSAVPRPSQATGHLYNRVSNKIWSAAHKTLAGKSSAKKSLMALEKDLNRLSRMAE